MLTFGKEDIQKQQKSDYVNNTLCFLNVIKKRYLVTNTNFEKEVENVKTEFDMSNQVSLFFVFNAHHFLYFITEILMYLKFKSSYL